MKTVICRDINNNKTDPVPVEQLSLTVRVYGVLIQDDKVLLVPQWDGYDFPGGGMEIGETLDEGLAREIKEETGLNAKRDTVLACESDFFLNPYSKKYSEDFLIYFLCKDISGEISDEGFDGHEQEYAKKAEWISRDKISSIKFYNPADSAGMIEKAFRMRESSL